MSEENRSQRALLIVDMINSFAHSEGRNFVGASRDILPFIYGELQYFRERMRPVIFCNTASLPPSETSSLEAEEFNSKVIQELSPRTGEICVKKEKHNAFFKTELADILHGMKIKNLTIVGVFSHKSIILTAAAALEKGFSVVVPETCVCAQREADQAAALRLIASWTKGD